MCVWGTVLLCIMVLCSFVFKLKNLFLGTILFVSLCLLLKHNFNNQEEDSLPVLLWWTPSVCLETVVACSQGRYRCHISTNRKYRDVKNLKALLFYGSQFKESDLPLPKTHPWALFHEESPKNSPLFLYKDVQEIFDFAATFSRYSEVPLTLLYLQNILNLTSKTYYVSIEEKNRLLRDTGIAPVLYIQSSCDTPSNRDEYVKELMKFVPVDSYGDCLKNRAFPQEILDIYQLDFYNEKLLKFVAKYKFAIGFENAECEDYITEKLWRSLIVGSVPIYKGSPSVKDWLPNHENSAILINDFPSAKDLADFIEIVNMNDSLYQSFLQHKSGRINNQQLRKSLKIGSYGLAESDNVFQSFSCEVCKKVHGDEAMRTTRKNSIYDCLPPKDTFWEGFYRRGKCESEILAENVNHNRRISTNQC